VIPPLAIRQVPAPNATAVAHTRAPFERCEQTPSGRRRATRTACSVCSIGDTATTVAGMTTSTTAGFTKIAKIGLSLLAPAALLIPPASAAAGATAAVIRTPLVRVVNATSSNWSGYATTRGPFSSVSASWVQPTGTCTSAATYAAFWVGIDGDGSNSVEQTGSDVDCHGGVPSYYAWYEMYPAFPVNYSDQVRPGDVFTASVTDSGSTFVLKISDTTQGWTHSQTKSSGTAKKHSAEIIAEAPSSGTGVLPLTKFGTVKFTSALANGAAIGTLSPQSITMVTSTGTVKAKPSALANGKNFSVTWHHR
jgi:hypothetical protein